MERQLVLEREGAWIYDWLLNKRIGWGWMNEERIEQMMGWIKDKGIIKNRKQISREIQNCSFNVKVDLVWVVDGGPSKLTKKV